MKMPKPTEETKSYFQAIVPDDPRVQIKPMFGQLAAFLNGNMFMGIFGDDVMIRLEESDREELLRSDGASIFDPGNGRPMKEYVLVPEDLRVDQAALDDWIEKSVTWVAEMPEKVPKSRRKK
jgi:TfoX/Sxy family transcriptional regulator of competence genes